MPNGLPTTKTWLPSFGPSAAGRIGRTARGETRSSVRPVCGSAATHCAAWRRPRWSCATIGAGLARLARGPDPAPRVSAGRVDPDRQDLAAMVDHHPRGDPPPAGRGVARGVLQHHDRLACPRHRRRRSAARIRPGPPASAPHRGRADARRPRRRRRRAAGEIRPGRARTRHPSAPTRRDPTAAPAPHAHRRPRARPFAAGHRRRPAPLAHRPAPRPQRPRRAPSSDDPTATMASVSTAHRPGEPPDHASPGCEGSGQTYFRGP